MPGPATIFTPGLGPAGPMRFDFRPLVPTRTGRISGVTRDSAGVVLPACTVKLFRTSDDRLVDQVVSGTDGSYAFANCSPAETYYAAAYSAGYGRGAYGAGTYGTNADVAGVTVNTLVGS